MTSSRRAFLKQISAATAVGLLQHVPGQQLWALTPGDLLPEPDEALLRMLALTAVDAARTAGAAFADVRVTATRRFNWSARLDRTRRQRPTMNPPGLAFTSGYGVRAVVNGAWGFAGGCALTADDVAEVARMAVTRARANRPRRIRTLQLAPAPVVDNGIWAPPIEQDPFDVPVGEQADRGLSALKAAEGVWGVTRANASAGWTQLVNVFASSENSIIVQRVTKGGARASAEGRSHERHGLRREGVPSLRSGWYGYEALGQVDLTTELRLAAERAVANSAPPVESSPVSVEVGRYDLVLSGWAVMHVAVATLAQALNLERALGYRANHEGTSFAAPPAEMLNQYQVGSPLVTLRADRTTPHAGASVGWDDEGVPASEFTLIQNGVIVDYLSSRQTAAEIGRSYQVRGDLVQSRGCMVGSGERQPEINLPNLTFMPGEEDISIDDLISDTRRGYYIPGGAPGGSDQQLLSGQFIGGGVTEIRNGKLGRPVRDFAFQILTPQFWKNIDALGGPRTVVEGGVGRNVGLVGQHDYSYRTWGAAARVREVNVLNTGITL